MKDLKCKIAAVALAAAMSIGGAFSLVSCGSNDSEDDSKNNNNAVVDGDSTDKTDNDGSTEEEPTKLSGSVTVYMPSPSGLADKLAEGFEAKTGVKVEQFQGTTGEILARLETEEANPQADVVILASWSDGLSMKVDGKLLSYKAENADKMNEGMVDSDYMLYGSSASAVGVIYNTNKYPDGLDADWADLADEKYKGDLAIPDPTKSGACKDFVAGMVTALDNGEEIFENLAANGMINGGGNKPALAMVEQGSKNILVGGVDYNAYSDMAKGEHIGFYYPKSGTVINPRPAMIMKTAPHVDNAKAFIDYLLSDEAQQLVADAYLIPGRADITTTKRTNVADIPVLSGLSWSTMMAQASSAAANIVAITKDNK